MNNTFLAAYVVFDQDSQRKLQALQDAIINANYCGNQTMGIPFHITLGSFAPEKEEELVRLMQSVALKTKSFDINFTDVGRFGDNVAFIQPQVNDELMRLHLLFDDNYGDGYPWHAHTTMFCPTSDADAVIAILRKNFQPFTARVVSIELYQVLPDRFVLNLPLCD